MHFLAHHSDPALSGPIQAAGFVMTIITWYGVPAVIVGWLLMATRRPAAADEQPGRRLARTGLICGLGFVIAHVATHELLEADGPLLAMFAFLAVMFVTATLAVRLSGRPGAALVGLAAALLGIAIPADLGVLGGPGPAATNALAAGVVVLLCLGSAAPVAHAVRLAGVPTFTAGVEATDRLTPLTDEWLTPVAIAGATAVAVLAATYRPSRPVRVHALREAST